MSRADAIDVWVDGLVFENGYQIGIWRVFHEVMRRAAGRVRFTLGLRSPPAQPTPEGVRIVRDRGRELIPRWDVLGRFRRKVALATNRYPDVRAAAVYHPSYYTECPVPGPARVVTVYDMIPEMMCSFDATCWWAGHSDPTIAVKRKVIQSADAVLAISQATAADLVRFYPEVADRVRVVHLGAEHLLTTRANAPEGGEPFVLFVGARHGYKNFRTVLDALRDPAWPTGVRLRLVGPPLAGDEERLVRALGLRDRIEPLGRVSDDELARLYAAARCFVFPSLLEGFGLPVLEAQANGCPAVLSDTAVFREVASDAAVFFDPRLGERLAEAVAVACEPATRRRLAEAGRENVRRFSWQRAAEQTVAVYEEVRCLRRAGVHA